MDHNPQHINPITHSAQDLTALPGVPELAAKLTDLPIEDARHLVQTLLNEIGGTTPLARLVHLHFILANLQSLKILSLAVDPQPVENKERYINMYSRLQGVMRRWVNTLNSINDNPNKSVELIYTINQLCIPPSSPQKTPVQKRRFNNFKHGFRSELLQPPPKEEQHHG